MNNPKALRDQLDAIAEKLKARGFELDKAAWQALESERKSLQSEVQELQHQRNAQSKQVGQLKSQGQDATEVLKALGELSGSLKDKEQQLKVLLEKIHHFELCIPNCPHDSVPAGQSEKDNELIRSWGEPKAFDFEPKDHVDLGEGLGQMDFAAAAKVSGSRFVILKGALVQLQRALTQYMLDQHTQEHGYTQLYVPYLVNEASLLGTGQLPKFGEDLFHTTGEHELMLIPTAEVPVTNLLRDTITSAEELPLRYVTHTPCFRSEAGSYGKDTRGMIRQHQFEKVEVVQCVQPENSYEVLEEIVNHAESILQALELPYRVVNLCAGDLGVCSAKTYDLEVWLPSQNTYREISSCSNFEDYQARRMQARFRANAEAKPQLLHTLNGSGLAVGRTLVAVIENYQQADGSIRIPKVLQSYMNGMELIA